MIRKFLFICLCCLSCNEESNDDYFELKINGHDWSAPAKLSFQTFFDGHSTVVCPVVYAEKVISNDSIESFVLFISSTSTQISFPDTIILSDTAFPYRMLIHSKRYIIQGEEAILTGTRSTNGSAIVINYQYDKVDSSTYVEGKFSALMSDGSVVTSGSFKVLHMHK